MTLMDQATCPVCGMAVDQQNAPSATYDDQTYYFCSEGCRDQFLADPGSFVGNTGS
jgi:YHS domain-containing protein